MTTNGPGRPRHPDLLTPAEWKVAELVRHGVTNRGVAERMDVSIDAVKFHVGNALSKLGFSGRDELRRWDGVARGTALDHKRRSAMDAITTSDSYMMLGQVARTVRSVADSRAWYRDTLGLPELYAFPGLAFFELGGVRLMLTEEGDGSQDSILYLRVPDLHATKDELEQRGVKFTHAPHMIHRHEDGTEEWMAFFEDNEGRPLAIMTQVRSSVRWAPVSATAQRWPTDLTVRDNPDRHRFEIDLGDGSFAFAEYNLITGKIMFSRTEVPPEHEGEGIGTALIRAGLDSARARSK